MRRHVRSKHLAANLSFKRKSMIDQKKVKALAAVDSSHSVSIYIPTHRVDGIQEDQIRYKNALTEAAHQLSTQTHLSAKEIKRLLKPATAKLEETEFWQHLSDCLALFIYDGHTEWHTAPLPIDTHVYVGQQLYLKPLLELMNDSSGFYLLVLSEDKVRPMEGTRYMMSEMIKNDDFPENLAEILRYYDPENSLQHHSGSGSDGVVYHGQGAGKQVEKARLEEYLRRVNEGVMTMVCDNDKKPLILATTPELVGIYREVNTYPHLLDAYVEGNLENVGLAVLHDKAWPVIEAQLTDKWQQKYEQFEQAKANEEASADLHEVILAAHAGQIDELFIAEGKEVYGIYDPKQHKVDIHKESQPDSQPLLNNAALAVWQQGGLIHRLNSEDMPAPDSPVNALLRYALQSS